jgi:cytoskeletal protein CcmA (bactofilin family)
VKSRDLCSKGTVLLLLTFIIMMTLTVVTGALLYMNSVRLRGSGADIMSSQAFWAAESGLQHYSYHLKTNSTYRNDFPDFNASLVVLDSGTGTYNVTCTDQRANRYFITSTGSMGSIDKKVTQTIILTTDLPDAFDYAVFGNTSSDRLDLKNNVVISGDFYYDGDVKVDKDAGVIDGFLYADDVSGNGTYTAAPGPPTPVPTYPAFDTSWYDTQITSCESAASQDWTLEGSSTYDLNGGTVYYQKITIQGDAAITGSGIIVATEDVKIKNRANISSDVTIVTKKNLKVEDDAVVQEGGVLYAREEIALKGSANVRGSLFVPEANGKVKLEDDAVLAGIIYADIVKLTDDVVITGSVVAKEYEKDEIGKNVRITYDAASLPAFIKNGFSADPLVSYSGWSEIDPGN